MVRKDSCLHHRGKTKRTGQVNHGKIVSRHELDGHVLPVVGRNGITIPRRAAGLANDVSHSGAGFAGVHSGADEREQRGEDQDSRSAKHFVVGRDRTSLEKTVGSQMLSANGRVWTIIAPATHLWRLNGPVETSQRVSFAKE